MELLTGKQETGELEETLFTLLVREGFSEHDIRKSMTEIENNSEVYKFDGKV